MASVDAAAEMWARTDLTPSDVDVAELYDGFTFLTFAWLEALGFCGDGEAGPFVEGATRIALDGELPLNTYGGQLSAGRMHGYWVLHEACLQLRGEAVSVRWRNGRGRGRRRGRRPDRGLHAAHPLTFMLRTPAPRVFAVAGVIGLAMTMSVGCSNTSGGTNDDQQIRDLYQQTNAAVDDFDTDKIVQLTCVKLQPEMRRTWPVQFRQ